MAIADHAGEIAAAQKIWDSVTPQGFSRYTQAGNIRQKKLTVYAANGAVAAKLKLLLPSLITRLQAQGLEITAILVEVQVPKHEKKPTKPMRSLSKNAAGTMETLAQKLGDSDLGKILTRLSKRI